MLAEMQQVKELLVKRMSHCVNQVFPNYLVEIYGSHATGLCLHWSDIDFIVGPTHDVIEKDMMQLTYEGRIKEALRRISECLKSEMMSY